jgi:hypothetical protein
MTRLVFGFTAAALVLSFGPLAAQANAGTRCATVTSKFERDDGVTVVRRERRCVEQPSCATVTRRIDRDDGVTIFRRQRSCV